MQPNFMENWVILIKFRWNVVAMPQISCSVTDEAAAYLRWLARNILFERSEHLAARHLMMHRLEETRRQYRRDEPGPDDLAIPESPKEDTDPIQK